MNGETPKNTEEKILSSLFERLRWDELTGQFAANLGVNEKKLSVDVLSALAARGVRVDSGMAWVVMDKEKAIERTTGVFQFEGAFFSVSMANGDYVPGDKAQSFLSAVGVRVEAVGGGGLSADKIPAKGAVRTLLVAGGLPAVAAAMRKAGGLNPEMRGVIVFKGARIFNDIFDFELSSSGNLISFVVRESLTSESSSAFDDALDQVKLKEAETLPLSVAEHTEDPLVLHALALSHDEARRLTAAKSIYSWPETIEKLVADVSLEVRAAAVFNPAMPRRSLWKMAHDPDFEPSAVAAAARPDLPHELASILAGHKSLEVKKTLALNANVPWEVVEHMLEGVADSVLEAACSRLDFPKDKIDKMVSRGGESAWMIVGRDDVPLDTARRLVHDNRHFGKFWLALASRKDIGDDDVNEIIDSGRGAQDACLELLSRSMLGGPVGFNRVATITRLIKADRFYAAEAAEKLLDSTCFDETQFTGLGRLLLICGPSELLTLSSKPSKLPDGLRKSVVETALSLGQSDFEDFAGRFFASGEFSDDELLLVTNGKPNAMSRKATWAINRGSSMKTLLEFREGRTDNVAALKSIGVPGKIAAKLLLDAKNRGDDLTWFADVKPLLEGMRSDSSETDYINDVNNFVTKAAANGAMKDAISVVAKSMDAERFGRLLSQIPPQKRLRIIEKSDGASETIVRDICDMFFRVRGTATAEPAATAVSEVLEFVKEADGRDLAGLRKFHDFMMSINKKLSQPKINLKPQDLYDVADLDGTMIETKSMGKLRMSFPKSSHALIDYGESLGICVGNGSYASRASKGEILLVGVLDETGKRKLGMVEAKCPGLSIVQARGHSNKTLPDDAQRGIRSFLSQVSKRRVTGRKKVAASG
jgi:hypothetical protein